MRGRVERVFGSLEDLIDALPTPPGHRDLLRIHLNVGREAAMAHPQLPAVQLPLLTHAAVGGEEEPAVPVAAACVLLYLGADLFDNVVDDELPNAWRGRNPAEASLAATTLLAAMPQLALDALRRTGTPPARVWALARHFAGALLTMGAGQREDLLFTGRDDVGGTECRLMAERKGGAEYALFAKSGALLATEDPAVVEKYAAFGHCLGTARQICTDVWDIWRRPESRDLRNGKRTLPIVHALFVLKGEPRAQLSKLLEAAREDAGPHDELREVLLEAGSVDYCGIVVESYRRRAREHLAAVSPREPAGSALRAMLDETTLLESNAPG